MRQIWDQSVWKVITITFCMGFAGVIGAIIICPDCDITINFIAVRWLQGTTLFFILWKGNEYVAILLDRSYPWLHYPLKRFTYGIIGALAFTSTILLIVGVSVSLIFEIPLTSEDMLPLYLANGLAVFMFCLIVARQFLLSWQELALREEKMKNELLSARYESLKNQVNPHFLFNSFNSLSTLIKEDPGTADNFVKQLSIMYRYVLETRTKEVVSVDEELIMMHSFVYLEKIRFGDNLRINININEKNRTKMILPLVLQMLLENAIKHNIISRDEPLSISIYDDTDFIIVSNKLQPKTILRNDSIKVGLENIKSRYKIFSDKEIIVEKSDEKFIVKIPLLELQDR